MLGNLLKIVAPKENLFLYHIDFLTVNLFE